jgi:hypothetical protein
MLTSFYFLIKQFLIWLASQPVGYNLRATRPELKFFQCVSVVILGAMPRQFL